jgi:hypothetical protein
VGILFLRVGYAITGLATIARASAAVTRHRVTLLPAGDVWRHYPVLAGCENASDDRDAGERHKGLLEPGIRR